MRVLQIITNLATGGAERLLVESIPLYQKKGIDMDLLLLNATRYPFYEELEKKKVNIFSLGLKSAYNPLHVFKIIPYLKKYDIIHVHLFPALYWVVFAKLLSFSKVKLVFTEHNTTNRRMESKYWRMLDRYIYKKYLKIVSISKEVEHSLQVHLNNNSKQLFKTIFNGINLDRFQKKIYSEENSIETTERVIIQISSFKKEKDQITLIKALKLLPSNVTLLLVGEGKNLAECKNLAAQLNIADRIQFLGIRTDIPELLASVDIAVLSSHYDGFGLVAVEAMASGVPLIASDVPGLNNVVGGAGLLFPVGDEKKLANQIQQLLGDSKLYHKVANLCYERSREYDINNMVDKYIGLYKELVS